MPKASLAGGAIQHISSVGAPSICSASTRFAPAARFDVMGLLPLLHEGAVIALTEDAATIRRSSNALLTYRRGDQAGAVCITEVKP